MNIFNNNSEQFIENKQGHLNVSGNNNVLHISNSNLTVSINGNHNFLDIQYSQINLQVNGNANSFKNSHNNLNYGFNGNGNEVDFDQNTTFNCQYSNGSDNRVPNRNRGPPPPPPPYHNQERNRNRSNQRHNRHRNRAQNQSHNQGRGSRQQRQENHNQLPYAMENGFPFNNGFMEQIQQIQANMNVLFHGRQRNGRNQATQYQFRPNRNIFVFHEEQQEDRGLKKQQYELLPRSQHSGSAVNCTICIDDIKTGDQETYLICFHAFHSECIRDWLVKNAKCPVCQFDLKQYFSQ